MGSFARMKSFLAQHDQVYEKPALQSDESVALANGEIGLQIWGDGHPLVLTVDKYDTWERRHKPYDFSIFNYENMKRVLAAGEEEEARRIFGHNWDLYGRDKLINPTRLPLGRVEIDFGAPATEFQMRLGLYEATAEGKLRFKRGAARVRAFVDAQREVMVVETEVSGRLKRPKISSRQARADLSYLGYPPPEYGEEEGVSWRRQRLVTDDHHVVAWRTLPGPRRRQATTYITIVTGEEASPALPRAVAMLLEAGKLGPAKLHKEHAKWWADYWSRSFLTVPDAAAEGLFYQSLYQLGSLSRPGHSLVSAYGVWDADDSIPYWAGEYTFDLNEEICYWTAYTSNHLEAALPLYEAIERWLPWLKKFGKGFFGFDGAFLTSATDDTGNMVPGWYTANLWLGNGPWAATHFWLHYLYSQDRVFLQHRAYPVMREFMKLYLGVLEEGEDGKLHIPCSFSPEWNNDSIRAWGKDTTGDLALARALAGILLKTVEILRVKDPDEARWREVLSRLAPYPQDAQTGLHVWLNQPYDMSHRHLTHLLAVYPLGLLTIEGSEEERKLAERSVRHVVNSGPGSWAGYTYVWMSMLASRLGWGEMAEAMLRSYADGFILPNSFNVNGDYRNKGHSGAVYRIATQETNIQAGAAVMEMLLQSWGGILRIFPSLPEKWGDAGFERLRGEGAFLVSAARREGKTEWVEITSEAGLRCRVRNAFNGEAVRLKDKRTGESRRLTGKEISFATRKGGTYLLTPWGAKAPAQKMPEFKRTGREVNWFGIKKVARF